MLWQAFPDDVKADFPFDMATRCGLTQVTGVSLAYHLARLERSRAVLLTQLRAMTLDGFRHTLAPDGVEYEVTPEWALYHLGEHESRLPGAQPEASSGEASRRRAIWLMTVGHSVRPPCASSLRRAHTASHPPVVGKTSRG